MTKSRAGQIEERRAQIPDIHKANYDKAMRGKSLRAGTKAFCLECVNWQKEEVRHCTDFACPLYPYRPYKNSSKQAPERLSLTQDLTNHAKR
jgi:hypothetical protein